MAKEIKLKEEAKKIKVAFGSRALPLGQRSPADLEQLAIIALEANDSHLLSMFESLPTLEELKPKVVDKKLPAIPAKSGEVVKQ